MLMKIYGKSVILFLMNKQQKEKVLVGNLSIYLQVLLNVNVVLLCMC